MPFFGKPLLKEFPPRDSCWLKFSASVALALFIWHCVQNNVNMALEHPKRIGNHGSVRNKTHVNHQFSSFCKTTTFPLTLKRKDPFLRMMFPSKRKSVPRLICCLIVLALIISPAVDAKRRRKKRKNKRIKHQCNYLKLEKLFHQVQPLKELP